MSMLLSLVITSLVCLGAATIPFRDMKYSRYQRRYISFVYGEMFRTPEQQTVYERKFFKTKAEPVPMKPRSPPFNYTNFCRIPPSPSPDNTEKSSFDVKREIHKRDVIDLNEPPTHHACCTSQRYFDAPPTAISDDDGSTQHIVQLNGGPFQYFLTQNCTQDPSCSLNCECQQEYSVYLALVWRRRPFYVSLEYIRIPGCCKCVN